MKEYLCENKMKIGWVVAGLGVLGLGYYMYTEIMERKKTTTPQEKQVLTFQQKYVKLIGEIQTMLDASNSVLTPQILKAIYRGQYYLGSQEIKDLTIKSRKERRKKNISPYDYAQIVIKYDNDVQSLLEKHLGAILARFHISKQQWIEETSRWYSSSEETEQEWQSLIKQEQDKQLDTLRDNRTNPKSFEKIRQIVEYKIHTLELITPDNIALDAGFDETAKYNIVDSYIRDCVYDKYSVEEEMVEFSISGMANVQKKEIQQLYVHYSQLMEDLIYENENEIEDSKNEDDEEDRNYY